ncbi:MAG: Fic family protein, partial [Gammaproteobacteria bacterium]|nr:Fic family protein [Gammaproteobacteria bacterium]
MSFRSPTAMEPLAPNITDQLKDKATDVIRRSASLSGALQPQTLDSIIDMMRLTNSYYSNRIEGNDTHPVEVQKALWATEARKSDENALREQSVIHVHIQKDIQQHLFGKPPDYVTSFDFISWLHRSFYENLPDELCWIKNETTGKTEQVIPGEMRTRLVEVGRHVAPDSDCLAAFFDRFHTFYDIEKLHGIDGVILSGAAHHRLAWLHPFLDGNGRVARLFTDAYLTSSGVQGYGLWNVSRGLARDVEQYRSLLAAADSQRQGDLNGRGNLSLSHLTRFSEYFLDICLDQIDFMAKALSIETFSQRIEGYINLRAAGMLPSLTDTADTKLKKESFLLLREALLRREFPRGDAMRITGLSERTARDILRNLVTEGL